VAQAKPITNGKADAKCLVEANKTLGPGFNPSDYTFHGGTEDSDNFDLRGTDDPDVFCGFGGGDSILRRLEAGDIFLGGEGNGTVTDNYDTFYGEAGNDSVEHNSPVGPFYGGPGIDTVFDVPGPVDGP
jgi:hypothetical protein